MCQLSSLFIDNDVDSLYNNSDEIIEDFRLTVKEDIVSALDGYRDFGKRKERWSMDKDITFDSVMKNHRYWPEDLDVDAMSECYRKIKRIKNLIFFEEMPKHPKAFVRLFSDEKFVDRLLSSMVESGITHLHRIWLREYPEETKQSLWDKGMLEILPAFAGVSTLIMCRNGDDFFVNLIP